MSLLRPRQLKLQLIQTATLAGVRVGNSEGAILVCKPLHTRPESDASTSPALRRAALVPAPTRGSNCCQHGRALGVSPSGFAPLGLQRPKNGGLCGRRRGGDERKRSRRRAASRLRSTTEPAQPSRRAAGRTSRPRCECVEKGGQHNVDFTNARLRTSVSAVAQHRPVVSNTCTPNDVAHAAAAATPAT